MLKIDRISLASCSLLVALAAFAASAAAQTDSGSFEELLDLDLAPLEAPVAPLPTLPDLVEPGTLQVAPVAPSFSIGSLEEAVPPPAEKRSVLDLSPVEVPHIALDPVDSEELLLPDLSVPTPENTRADIAPAIVPRLHAPQPLTYPRAGPASSFKRYRTRSIPLQIEFYTVRQVNPYVVPYTYRPYGYQAFGGYQPYGGYRGSLGVRPPRGLGCAGGRR